jgi:hypothetical protein
MNNLKFTIIKLTMWKNRQITVLILSIFCFQAFSYDLEYYLVPKPKETAKIENTYNHASFEELCKLNEFLTQIKFDDFQGVVEFRRFANRQTLSFHIDSIACKDFSYILQVGDSTIKISGKDNTALFYARLTLLQVLDFALTEKKQIPCLTIKDKPDFERRGYMLDISRDKVPTMETIYRIIDMLAEWKINELQLYTEHTFAYKNHRAVWGNSSPLTAEEVLLIDRYCRDRYIDLVPNQNSFGHMENWLKHDEYLHLAECKENCKTEWGLMKRHSLDPTNPESFKLMQELYAELLPNFSSPYFNIGCDETVELGLGGSKPVCDKLGKGRVYLNYLEKLNEEVGKYDKQVQFWGDIILNHPELISEVPEDMIALIWGYSASYSFEDKLKKFRNTELKYYVCPGTSTWRSLIGRNFNAFKNLANASIYGKKYGAKGYLNTDWGDYGHWQPLSVSYPTMLIGASYAWNYDEKALKKLEYQLNHYIFKDETENTAKAILKLGNAYLKTNIPAGNANAFHLMLRRYKWTMKGQYQTKKLNSSGLKNAEKEINDALGVLALASPHCTDSSIILQEINLAAQLSIHGIHLGEERLNAKGMSTAKIPKAKKQMLYDELNPLIEKHKEIWILRNRAGGLADSAAKLEELLDYYNQ